MDKESENDNEEDFDEKSLNEKEASLLNLDPKENEERRGRDCFKRVSTKFCFLLS